MKSPDDKNKLIIDTETAPIVHNIYHWRKEGMSNAGIARELNAMGIPTPSSYRCNKGISKSQQRTNNLWCSQTIKGILQNPVYTGCVSQGKHKQRLGMPTIRAAPEDWINIEDTHEAIITKEVFEEVAAILNNTKAAYYKRLEHRL